MKKVMKAVAALMLTVTTVFSTGCGNSSNSVEITKASDYVDLGLPSGTLWATCNIGAGIPESYGEYFAWGETEPWTKSNNNKYCNKNCKQITKYCSQSEYGYNGFTDSLIVLASDDDAATVNWGKAWYMPTRDQWDELYQNTNNSWVTQNGVDGRLFTASNGNTLFLPATGICNDEGVALEGYYGGYWSSSLETSSPSHAVCISFAKKDISKNSFFNNGATGSTFRTEGLSVRPVRSTK